MPDEQRYKYFIATDLPSRLADTPVPLERTAPFARALEEIPFGEGEAMYLYDEWRDFITFDDFAAIGKALNTTKA